MTTSVRQILDAFEALSEADRHEVITALFRRVEKVEPSPGDEDDEDLVRLAEMTFLELDAQEAADDLA